MWVAAAGICSSAFMKDVWRNVRSTDTTWGLSIKVLLEVSQLCSLWVRWRQSGLEWSWWKIEEEAGADAGVKLSQSCDVWISLNATRKCYTNVPKREREKKKKKAHGDGFWENIRRENSNCGRQSCGGFSSGGKSYFTWCHVWKEPKLVLNACRKVYTCMILQR